VGAMLFANKQVSNNNNSNSNNNNYSNTNAMMLKQRQAQLSPQTPMIMMMPQQNQQQQLMALPQQQMTPLAPPQRQAAPLVELQEQAIPQQSAMMMMTSQSEVSPSPQEQQAQLQESPLQTALETPTLTATKHAKTNKRGHRPAVNHRPLPRNPQPPQQLPPPQQQILYYDPEQAMVNGQLEVPMTVYDQHGNPIPLQNLRGARILMEPPQARIQGNPRQMISAQDMQKWGESTSQDQSIIVATVAVMALLVGALSARRMRARNVLSACIENEALEDDVAYDTAYTTSQKDNSYYNTFASGGWKGDLEKFDV
jgi:hypothetical protein